MDPAQTQLATVMATLQIKSEHEAKLKIHLLHKTLLDTASTVSTNKQDILQVKDTLSKTEGECSQLKTNQDQIYSQLGSVNEL